MSAKERIMNRFRFNRWLLCLVLAVSAAGTWWGYSRSSAGVGTEGKHDPAATSHGLPGAVCFGHVDLMHGITDLHSARPGRVTEVLVAEGRRSSPGQSWSGWRIACRERRSRRQRPRYSPPRHNFPWPGRRLSSTRPGLPNSRPPSRRWSTASPPRSTCLATTKLWVTSSATRT